MTKSNWKSKQILFKWLALAALGEWLVARTATRAAIHVPKPPPVMAMYTAVNQIGLIAAAFVTLLALTLLGWMMWQEWQTQRRLFLPLMLAGLVGLTLAFLVIVPPAWLALVYQLLAAGVIVRMGTAWMWGRGKGVKEKKDLWLGVATFLPALVLLVGVLYQLLPNLYAAWHWPGPPPLTGDLFNLGELLVIVCVAVWGWVYGRHASYRLWLLAAIPALFFALSFQRDPAMTGILTIWSTGLTLFLPWPVYAIALWVVGVTVLANWHRQPPVAYAILLFAAAGYAPQLSTQLFYALIGLWLLSRPLPELNEEYANSGKKDVLATVTPALITDNPG